MGIFDVFKGKPVTPAQRKQNSINKIRTQGIVYNPHLPMVESSADVKLKSFSGNLLKDMVYKINYYLKKENYLKVDILNKMQ